MRKGKGKGKGEEKRKGKGKGKGKGKRKGKGNGKGEGKRGTGNWEKGEWEGTPVGLSSRPPPRGAYSGEQKRPPPPLKRIKRGAPGVSSGRNTLRSSDCHGLKGSRGFSY